VRRKVIEAARAMGLRRQLPPSYRPLIRINLDLARAYLSLLEGIAAEFRSLTKPMSRQSSLQLSALLANLRRRSVRLYGQRNATRLSSMRRTAP
jgi:hypothetical protein